MFQTFYHISGCTFEFGLCQWTAVPAVLSSSITQWVHRSASSQSTGPSHNIVLYRKGDGHYMYVEGSGSTMETAVLRGQEFSYDDNTCSLAVLHFVSKPFSGKLRVKTVLSNGSVMLRNVTFTEGRWMWTEFVSFNWVKEMKQSNITMHVEFIAEVVIGDFIALDDIQYLQCAGWLCNNGNSVLVQQSYFLCNLCIVCVCARARVPVLLVMPSSLHLFVSLLTCVAWCSSLEWLISKAMPLSFTFLHPQHGCPSLRGKCDGHLHFTCLDIFSRWLQPSPH